MDNKSSAVVRSREKKLHSALVRGFDDWSTPYDLKPDGVFGSLAKIRSGDVTISSAELDVEFQVPFDDDMEPGEAEIIVYNLSDSTIKQFKQNAAISIEAGYTGDTGVIFQGYICKVTTKFDGADKVTTIKAMDDIKDHTVESISYAEGTKASYILKDLIGRTGTPVAVFQVRRDHTYEDAQTVDGDLMEAIKQYAEVCGISVYISKGKIYARHLKDGDNLNFSLSADTGLIGSPSPYTEEIKAENFTDTVEGYKVEMLLQHRLSAGAIVTLKSRFANGTYRVCSGEHRFSPDEAVTVAKMY